MRSSRVWLFRILILATVALFLVSWLIPWWRSNIQEAGMFVQIRPWGLEHNLGSYTQYMGGDASMPVFFAPLMWLYLVLAIGALLAAAFMKDRIVEVLEAFDLSVPQTLIVLVGLSYIVFVLVFLIYAKMRTGSFGVEFMGISYITIEGFHLGAEAISRLQPGFYLACVVGPLCLVLALLRGAILGKAKGKA
jgi:hypothetical protein